MFLVQKFLIASIVVLESGENLANKFNIICKFSEFLIVFVFWIFSGFLEFTELFSKSFSCIIGIVFSTWSLPSVSVPVLSKQRVSTLANVSMQ